MANKKVKAAFLDQSQGVPGSHLPTQKRDKPIRMQVHQLWRPWPSPRRGARMTRKTLLHLESMVELGFWGRACCLGQREVRGHPNFLGPGPAPLPLPFQSRRPRLWKQCRPSCSGVVSVSAGQDGTCSRGWRGGGKGWGCFGPVTSMGAGHSSGESWPRHAPLSLWVPERLMPGTRGPLGSQTRF